MSLLHRTRAREDELPELTAQQLAELDALDAALAGEEIADAALAALVRDVTSVAPELGSDGTQRVKERLGERFGSRGGRIERRPQWRSRLLHGPGAVAASLLVVAVIGSGALSVVGESQKGGGLSEVVRSSNDDETAAPSAASSATAESGASSSATAQSAPSSGGTGEATAKSGDSAQSERESAPRTSSTTAAPKGLADADRTTGRSVERMVDLAVRVENGKLEEAAGKVGTITRQASGYIAGSTMNLGRAGEGSSSFQLRLDTSRLDQAIDRLSALGTVTAQNESTQDITSTLDSARQQLADARAARAALLKALSSATTAGEIASLREQIAANRRLLTRLDAQVQRVQRRADLTTVTLTVSAPAKGDPSADDGSWSLGEAAGDAWSVLRVLIGALLVGTAVVAPFALIGGAAYAIRRRRQRSARERALDA